MADFLKNKDDDARSEDDMQDDDEDEQDSATECEEEDEDDEDYTYESDDDMNDAPSLERAYSEEMGFFVPEGSCVFVNYKGARSICYFVNNVSL